MLTGLLQKIHARHWKKAYKAFLKRFAATDSWVEPGSMLNDQTFPSERVFLGQGDYRGTQIGKGSYTGQNAILPNSKIGSFCSIGWDVSIIAGSHPTKYVSTYPGFCGHGGNSVLFCAKLPFEEFKFTSQGHAIEIGNDVWIGAHVRIMQGVTIGNGAVIGACSLVTKDVPPYSIVGGVPARVIKYRFSQEDIDFLQSIKWWDWPFERIDYYSPFFNSPSCLRKFLSDEQITS